MRTIGTSARGIRLPIISAGDDLAPIVVDSVLAAVGQEKLTLRDRDVICITEAIVAKSQSNFVTLDNIAGDVRQKRHIVNALMGFAVAADKTAAVKGEQHRQVLQSGIVNYLIYRTLDKS